MRSIERCLVVLVLLAFTLTTRVYAPAVKFETERGLSDTKPATHLQLQKHDIRTFEDKINLYGSASKIPVLMYHHILEKKDRTGTNSLIITTKEFNRQMEYLYENDYTTITAEELEAFLNSELDLPQKSVLIVFDDGYKSSYIYAYPILKQYGFKAAVALIPKYMPDTVQRFNPARLNCMSWEEADQASDVFEYMNHTYSHASMKELSYKQSLEEISEADALLGSSYFVYPIGHTSANAEKVLKKLDYGLAFTTKPGFVTKASRRLYLPRQRIVAGMTIRYFGKLLGEE